MQIQPLTRPRKLMLINFAIVLYFLLIYLINLWQIDSVLIGVFRELLTIPFLIVQLISFTLSVRCIIQKEYSIGFIISLLLLITCSIITFSSFF